MPIEMQVSREFNEKKIRPTCCNCAACRGVRGQVDRHPARGSSSGSAAGATGTARTSPMAPDFEAEILETLAVLTERSVSCSAASAIHWCPTDRTALAMAEIEYADAPSPSIYVRFPLRKDATARSPRGRTRAPSRGTTTPWTLPANLGLMVDPVAKYAVVRLKGHVLIVAAVSRRSRSCSARSPRTLGELDGASLVGSIFEAPFGNDSRAVDGTPYVSMEDGTGIVHTAPGHGTEDFIVGARNGLGINCPVDEAGKLTSDVPHFAGRSVLDERRHHRVARHRGRSSRTSSKFTHSALLALPQARHLPGHRPVVHDGGPRRPSRPLRGRDRAPVSGIRRTRRTASAKR